MNPKARFRSRLIEAIPDHATRAHCLYADTPPPLVIVCQGHLRPVSSAAVGSQTQVHRLKRKQRASEGWQDYPAIDQVTVISCDRCPCAGYVTGSIHVTTGENTQRLPEHLDAEASRQTVR